MAAIIGERRVSGAGGAFLARAARLWYNTGKKGQAAMPANYDKYTVTQYCVNSILGHIEAGEPL